MRGNLAFSDTPEDDDFRRPSHPSRPSWNIIDNTNRSNSTPPSRPQPGEDEIMVDFGLWVVFNKRILTLIRRKYPNSNR
jgi:hypothetical protein